MKDVKDVKKDDRFEKLNKELLALLGKQDSKAVKVIDKIMKLGEELEDADMIGYAYYRYAYYSYFTVHDLKKFRKDLQVAIRYLLRIDNKEYLGGAYDLVAYDASDLGCYDVAYAFYMMAIQACEGLEGIALPGMVEANAGRLLLELGDYEKGRASLLSGVKKMKEFPGMHVYNYNMILTYADVAMASFQLGDLEGVKSVLEEVEHHYGNASKQEIHLSKTYYLVTKVYYALLSRDEEMLEDVLKVLLKHWKGLPWSEIFGVIIEAEAICRYMLKHGYTTQVAQILKAMEGITNYENNSIVMRYYTLAVEYYEQIHDFTNMRKYLLLQHEIHKKLKSEVIGKIQYSMEFTEMIEDIAKERRLVAEENMALKIKANTDALTELPNRNAMNRTLQRMFTEAAEKKLSFGVGIIDVDDFKQFNDVHGHQAGDECLRCIGKVLNPFNDDPRVFCARYGGDEFVVGYLDFTTAEINKLKKAMHKQVLTASKEMVGEPIVISQGVYNAIPTGKKKLWDYLSIADRKLYKIKNNR